MPRAPFALLSCLAFVAACSSGSGASGPADLSDASGRTEVAEVGPPADVDAAEAVVADASLPDALVEPIAEVTEVAWATSEGSAADDEECPVAVIQVEEGQQVMPQTVLHLHGDASHSGAGAIASYQWTVESPTGSVAFLIPSSTFPQPLFEANVAGKYVFSLGVVDEAGRTSCVPARLAVYVVPDAAIHVELLWETPGDPDPTDEGPGAGTDLDLHVAHPFAGACTLPEGPFHEPWFDPLYDCWSANPSPDWGSPDSPAQGDPRLDRDDADGAGPESFEFLIPEGDPSMPYAYRAAVHYRDDHGFGPSYATLRVYIYSALAFEVGDVELQPGDLWQVCTVEWPSTKVTLTLNAQGNYDVRPDYPVTLPCP